MIQGEDKRGFIRMPVRCPISMLSQGSARREIGELVDLSGSGIRFISPRALEEGARLQVAVNPELNVTPPLEAEVSIVRCHALDDGFDIAASFEMIVQTEYIDID